MTISSLIVAILLIMAVAVEWLCLFGLLVMRNPYDRLHAIAPASILPPLFVAAAVLVANGFSASGFKVIAVALVLIVSGPLLTHAIARAARIRETGEIALRD
ncbi:MAG TPA: monovalent cation/H(+) antiporter subunit G [Chthoniobacterales bacterium]|jgi:multicomponent Na+:H+ antiporter subunit G